MQDILSKLESSIFISSEVMGGKKNRDMNFLTPRKTKTKKDKNLNFAGVVGYLSIHILSKSMSPILISSEVMRGKKIVT